MGKVNYLITIVFTSILFFFFLEPAFTQQEDVPDGTYEMLTLIRTTLQ